jgi:hypothetical protein
VAAGGERRGQEDGGGDDNVGDWKSPLEPWHDMPEKNDAEYFLSRVNNKKMASVIYQNLFSLLSFLAVDATYFGEPLQDNGQLYESAYLKFHLVLGDSLLASSYWCENFYGFLPEAELPACWKTKLQLFFEKRKIKKKFKASKFCLGQSDAKICMLYNGQTIINKAKAVMREVNNRVNNLWKDPRDFPSGTTQTAVLYAIRNRAWPKEAEKKVKNKTVS